MSGVFLGSAYPRCMFPEFKAAEAKIGTLRENETDDSIRLIDPAIKYVMPECFRRASIPLDSRLRGNDGLDI